MNKEQWLIIGAFFCTYVVWGSTYLANYWAIESIPVFGMAGCRFLVAGTILYLLSFFVGDKERPTLQQWKNAGIIGFLFLTIGVGAVVWAQQWVPTSTTALLISFQPLVVMTMMWVLLDNRPPGRAFIGAAISIGGMALLINQPASMGEGGGGKGIFGILAGLLCWGLGMTISARMDMGKNRFRTSAMQMLVGGTLLLIFSASLGEWAGWSPAQLTARSFFSWAFLVVFGSVVAYTAFNYLLAKVSPDKASTSTYVNPVVAVLLGAWLNKEAISTQTLVAGAVLLTGVWFINTARRVKPTVAPLDGVMKRKGG